MILLFIKGILLGLAVAIPIGPVGLLCIRRTLKAGFFSGAISGLGAAVADGFYAAVAAFGLTMISNLLFELEKPIRLLGGIFLFVLAWKIYTSKKVNELHLQKNNPVQVFISTLMLTLTNPATIVFFTAVFAGFNLLKDETAQAVTVVLGVFAGSMLWWIFLSGFVTITHKKLSNKNILLINKFSAVLLLLFGLWAILGLFFNSPWL